VVIDPKLLQWAAALLLILSGVQNLVGLNTHRGVSGGLRALGALIGLAATAVGILLIVNLMGVRG
jgi:hypothetical protein